MSKRFPRLTNNQSVFPDLESVNVYQYDNQFDYTRYNALQMRLQICTVPWDMGEAHIGNRTISGIGNVVYFGSESARDAYFDAIPDSQCYRFETKYKELHRDMFIDVPIPYDMCARHNYLVVHYELFANDDSPVAYEENTGKRDWFWFIREVEFIAPNTTRLHIMEDAWQTWIYDVNITGMMLERGHAPMKATKISDYLTNPIGNNQYLLAEDVNYGEATIAQKTSALVMNASNMKAVIISTANPVSGTWGTKSGDDWNVSADSHFQTQGVPSYCAFCLDVANLSTLLFNIDSTVPQFAQTIKAICFISSSLLTIGSSFTFCSIACNTVGAGYKTSNLYTLTKADFGYATEYADIPKLYSYPYSYIKITDENGSSMDVRIEETSGKLQFVSCVNLVFPFLNISGYVSGLGKAASQSVTFANVSSTTFSIAGNWFDYIKTWQIPTFAITQAPQTRNDYATHFDREQAAIAYTNQYNSEIANADTQSLNADLAIAANTATTTRSNTGIQTDSTNAQTANSAKTIADNSIVSLSVLSTIAANEAQGNIAAASSLATGVLGAVGSVASGNPLGAATSIVGGIVGAGTTSASTSVGNNLSSANAGYTIAGNNAGLAVANGKTANDATNHTSVQSDLTDIQNDLTDGTTDNTVATEKANAGRTQNTAQNAIDNQIAQAALNPPEEYGAFSNGQTASVKPMALFANVITQSDYAIKRAGDEFLRYGYHYDGLWNFDGNWNVCKYFTYWKLSDFWVSGLNVPDMYMDRLRFFLFGGVTVWSDPTKIGNVTIYDN